MEELLQSLAKLTSLTEAQLLPIHHYFIPFTARQGTTLSIPGAVSTAAWFIGRGSLRAFYMVEEKKHARTGPNKEKHSREITNWIVSDGGILTDIRSFLHQVPALYCIETLEKCRLYRLSYDHCLAMQKSHPEVARAIFENTLIMADLRMQMCNLRDAAERLAMFEHMYPGMCGRLSVNIQASYLNIDPTTLSRLRGIKRIV